MVYSKVTNFKTFEDYTGRFIAYCDNSVHRGMVLRPRVCESRECKD